MVSRFTKSARAVVERAQHEALASGSGAVGAQELLLGVATGDGRGARVLAEHGATPEALRGRADALDGEALAAIGIDLDEIRRRAEQSFGPGALDRARRPRAGHVPVSPDAKRALEQSLQEALALRDREILDVHVLLGLLREDGAERMLRAAGADPAAVRAALSPAESRRGRGA